VKRKCFKMLEVTDLGKGKAIAIQAWTVPSGSKRFRLPEFLEKRYMKFSRLSALAPAVFTPPPPPGDKFGTNLC